LFITTCIEKQCTRPLSIVFDQSEEINYINQTFIADVSALNQRWSESEFFDFNSTPTQKSLTLAPVPDPVLSKMLNSNSFWLIHSFIHFVLLPQVK